MMGNCKNCKFWDFRHKNQDGSAECWAFDWQVIKQPIKRDAAAMELWMSDDYGLHYKFKTGPNFGCVKFLDRKMGENNE